MDQPLRLEVEPPDAHPGDFRQETGRWGLGPRARHLSTPPMIGSNEAMTAIASAIRWPGISVPTAWRWTKDGSWIRIRNGWSVPSLITYAAYWPRGPSTAA